MSLSFNRRHERAVGWPLHTWHYAIRLWKIRERIDPPLSWREVIPLAMKHTHSFIWGHIRWIDLYLPKRRQYVARERQSSVAA